MIDINFEIGKRMFWAVIIIVFAILGEKVIQNFKNIKIGISDFIERGLKRSWK